MNRYLRRFAAAPATRPVLTVYIAAVLIAWAVADRLLRFDFGVILLGVVVALVILASMYQEVAKVHVLVNSQRDALVARIDQLETALLASGERIPDDHSGRN